MTLDDIIRKARTVSVLRASDEGKRLAERNPELGYDTVSLTFKLPPAEADYVLRFLGRRDGAA